MLKQNKLINPNFEKKGYIQIYTGNGKGKTTASLGLTLRALGRNWRVLIVMFCKGQGNVYGELISFSNLNDNIKSKLKIIQSGLNRIVYKNNAKVLMDALDKLGIWYCGGKNSPYIWMRCPGKMSSWEFFDRLLFKVQVIGTPGAGFGSCGEGYFRFSTFGSPEDTKEAASRLCALL